MSLVKLDEWYEPSEMCELLHIKDGHNYARDVKTRLDRAGFQYLYKTKRVKFLAEPRDIEKRLRFLLELKEIQVVEIRDFAIFYYCLINFEDYQYCPWKYRAKLLNENYGCNVDDKKLTRWGKMLKDASLIKKIPPTNKTIWKTYWTKDGIYQEPLDKEALEKKEEYWDFFWDRMQYYTRNPEKTSLSPAQQAGIESRQKFGCCYYSCNNYLTCLWKSKEEEQDIKSIINEYVSFIL